MSYEYGQGLPNPPKKDSSQIWSNIFSGVDKFLTYKTTQQQQKLTQEQQRLAEIRIKQLQEEGKLTAQQADAELAKLQSQKDLADSEQAGILAKIKANKAILIPLAIAGSLAIAGVGYYYFKKSKKA